MTTKQRWQRIAQANANEMLDQTTAFPTIEDAFWAYSQNVEDTVLEYYGPDHATHIKARNLYDSLVKSVFTPEV